MSIVNTSAFAPVYGLRRFRSHWAAFAAFCQAELDTGGPDPQFATLFENAKHARDMQPADWVWLIGCYAAHHTVAGAWAVFDTFSDVHDLRTTRPAALAPWLRRHWGSLPVRPEMRSHRMLNKRCECLLGFASYAVSMSWWAGDYQHTFIESQKYVPFYGRYMAIKVLEMLRLTVRPDLRTPDMRAKGGWGPRATLALLYPRYARWLADRSMNDDVTVTNVERIARKVQAQLQQQYSVTVSLFQLQVLLCEYREMLAGGYYPGASLDEEIKYIRQAETQFDMSAIWEARKRVFADYDLLELGGVKATPEAKQASWLVRTQGLPTLNTILSR